MLLLSPLPTISVDLASSPSCRRSEKAEGEQRQPREERGARKAPRALRWESLPEAESRRPAGPLPSFPGQRAPAVINVAVTTPLLGIFLSADGNTALGKARAALGALIAHFLKQFT